MNKNYLFVIGFLVLLIAAGAYFVNKIPSRSSMNDSLSQSLETSDNINASDSTETLGVATTPEASATTKMDDKLVIKDEVVGTGAEAVVGKKITVNYTGTLTDGKPFDSNIIPSFGHVEPFTFVLGEGRVIEGWEQGFNGMKVGGKRKLTIPPSLGYGAEAAGSIPANSTLIFEVELLKVE